MAYRYKQVILTITGIVYCSMPSIYIGYYTVYVWFVSYLSNQWNHLFIMNQKTTMMAISFKINMLVYVVFVIPLVVYMELVLLF